MEFSFNLNTLWKDESIVLDRRLAVTGSTRSLSLSSQDQIRQVVDKAGKLSAMAQGLRQPITTADKLRSSEHRLYLLKDSADNDGAGVLVGMLKVGQKKLFVLDSQGVQNEMQPLCVLDFYVHESRQRQGLGKRLFEMMLQAEGVHPHHLAVDRPSPKFVAFLSKHYGLCDQIPQRINFVVFNGFFANRNDHVIRWGSPYALRDRPYTVRSHNNTWLYDNSDSPEESPHGAVPLSRLVQEKEAFKAVSGVSPSHLRSGLAEYDFVRSSSPQDNMMLATRSRSRGLSAQGGRYSRHSFESRVGSPSSQGSTSPGGNTRHEGPVQYNVLGLPVRQYNTRGHYNMRR